MSKLDDILDNCYRRLNPRNIQAKQQIKELMLELIDTEQQRVTGLANCGHLENVRKKVESL